MLGASGLIDLQANKERNKQILIKLEGIKNPN